MYRMVLFIGIVVCSLFAPLRCEDGIKEPSDSSAQFDLLQIITQNSNTKAVPPNPSNDLEPVLFGPLAKQSYSFRARFLRARIEEVIQNLNRTISAARNSTKEYKEKLSAAAEAFASKIHEDIQILRESIDKTVTEAMAKLQSKAVGIYECSQEQLAIANSWITSSMDDLNKCAVPANKAADIVNNATTAIEVASVTLNTIGSELEFCLSSDNSANLDSCLSNALYDADSAAFAMASQLAFLMLQAGRSVVTLPATLNVCGSSLLATLNTGVTQSIVSIGECAVGILL